MTSRAAEETLSPSTPRRRSALASPLSDTSVATRRRPGSERSRPAVPNRSLPTPAQVAGAREHVGGRGVGVCGRTSHHQLTLPDAAPSDASRSARKRSTTRLWRASSSEALPDDATGQAGREGAHLGTQRGDRLLALRLDLSLAVLDDARGLGLGRSRISATIWATCSRASSRMRAASCRASPSCFRARRAWRRPRPAWSRPRRAHPRSPVCARSVHHPRRADKPYRVRIPVNRNCVCDYSDNK